MFRRQTPSERAKESLAVAGLFAYGHACSLVRPSAVGRKGFWRGLLLPRATRASWQLARFVAAKLG